MSFDEAEVSLGCGRRALVIRQWDVTRSSPHGPVQFRRHGKLVTVEARFVSEISPSQAHYLARELLDPSASGFSSFAAGDLTMWHGQDGRQQALEDLLVDGYLLIELNTHQGLWLGDGAQPPRRTSQEPAPRETPRTWVAVTVVDENDPARPLGGLHFQMRTPDGSTRTGALDRQGHVLVEDIEPGRCWVDLKDVRRGFTP